VYEHVSVPKFTATIDFESEGDQTSIRWEMVFDTVEEFVHTFKTFKADDGLKQNVEKPSVYQHGLK